MKNPRPSVVKEVVRRAQRSSGTKDASVHQLAGTDPEAGAEEFRRLSQLATGNRAGWKFDREELHQH